LKTLLDIEKWPRAEHFHFFRQFEEPFFGATVEIDCTIAYEKSKKLGSSFFIYYLHKTLVAVNSIESFRYRIADDKIYLNDRIDASATIGRPDGTFGFSLIEYDRSFDVFEATALAEIERIQSTTGIFTRTFEDDNVVHLSAIPWVNFTSLSHARIYTLPDSCPKISFGKMMVSETGTRTMSMSVHVHHGLMDGMHLGQFVDCFQEIMNQ
jgi:chloramphenicol O-acetyltransferase type A